MLPLICILGPTASGKSALALEVCTRLGGEIVSCDSMQIYRGCDIVTAKPTLDEQAEVPHHLLDICNPNERFSAAQWAQDARNVIADIESRGKRAVVCGGTGFYLRALLFPDFLSSVPPDDELKAHLEAQLKTDGAEKMHAQLEAIDASAAQRLHPNDSFRVLRALEIALLQSQLEPVEVTSQAESSFESRIFGLERPRQQLYARIDARVLAMMEAGALDELETLRQKWGDDAPALGGVGYKQMLPVVRGEITLESGLESWQRDSRRYAKRQMTWLRHQLPLEWLDATRETAELADEIAG